MKIAFLGTPEFAVPSLKMLIAAGHETEVFTQPDRPKDRGHALAMPAVKLCALENGLTVHQFERIRSEEGASALEAFAPDLMVTAAFGQLLSQRNLDTPKHGTINVHGSLLPAYRGASPIQTAIINGEQITGVTTMLTNIGMDTGDILLQASTPIGENETYGELYSRLSVMGAELLRETIEALENGTLEPVPQDEALATRCRPIRKRDAMIDFRMSSKRIHDLVRGLDPSPIAYAKLGGANIKIYKTTVIAPGEPIRGADPERLAAAVPGEVLAAGPKVGLVVKTGDGSVSIDELQFPGGKRMSAKSAMNGKKLGGAAFDIPEDDE